LASIKRPDRGYSTNRRDQAIAGSLRFPGNENEALEEELLGLGAELVGVGATKISVIKKM
jgi:hypothetical protein